MTRAQNTLEIKGFSSQDMGISQQVETMVKSGFTTVKADTPVKSRRDCCPGQSRGQEPADIPYIPEVCHGI